MLRSLAGMGAVVAALALAAGCGGEESSALCDSLGDLQLEVQALRDVELGEGAVSQLEGTANEIRADVDAVREAGDEQVGQEVDAFEAALETLIADVQAAAESGDVSAETLQGLSASVSATGEAYQSLQAAAPDCDLSEN